ncbi:hypothetical protein GH714_022859 [Hevea brasiliensis]|uniref:RanBD1 domain-containing protein n=1 Tax=Hevea brasiliensis TaxID=3981 RepID=A0A6A6LMH6_HEVBR|nr:hypothetical protein GH714_022859 [Hevea brasiliensis]
MGDTEHALPPSKKRAAGREISRDNPGLDDEEDLAEQETGTFKRASDEVLASRRIVKQQLKNSLLVRKFRKMGKLILETGKESESKIEEPVAETAAKEEITEDKENNNVVNEATKSKVDNEKPEEDDKTQNEKAVGGEETENKEAAEGDKTESEEKKDNGLAGTGFCTSTFTFGSVPKDGSSSGTGTGSLFGQKNDQPSFSFGLSNNGNSSIFNTMGSSIVSKNEGTGFPSMQEVPVETGEENERVVFSADSVLFEFFNGAWKERGKGELKINVSTSGTERARLLMRARGNYRLILNASLYPDMKLTNMDKRGVTFACMNSTGENKDGLSTFALKFKDGSIAEEFRAAVAAH